MNLANVVTPAGSLCSFCGAIALCLCACTRFLGSGSGGLGQLVLGRLGIPGIFDGRHHFSLTPTDRGTHLEQSETFTGILTALLLRMVGEDTENGFRAMNEALKARAEAG